ncbi:type IA DNA topoisomerase [Halalkalibacter flavus]|uniref:type IA DNA topoisomerase n=1 Tax=Halalkalibacter flavus TaxID=3090668 RepID=UPI002FC85593
MGNCTVVLAEKPSQARAYSDAFKGTKRENGYISVQDDRFFSGEAYITWGFGHLVSLVMPGQYKKEWENWSLEHLPILPEQFQYEVPNDKKAQFTIVKSLLKKATDIVIATDSDREGENIARSIIREAGADHKPTKRLWINSLEVEEVQKGFQTLKDGSTFLSRYEEAQARQLGDWLVGMNASPLFSLILQKRGIRETFSVGRVQTPTLYMIFSRQMEIKHFKPQPFFELFADINVRNDQFQTKYSGRFDHKQDIQTLLDQHNVQNNENTSITRLQKDLKETKSPKLHSLSTLQTKANKKWRYSPSDVLKIMQSLYERKILTYPRTDSNFITESEFNYLKANLEGYKKVANVEFDLAFSEPQKRYVDGSKVQEHHAIIPTKTIPTIESIQQLNEKEKNIYFEVLLTTLAMFASNYQYEETIVEVDIKGLLFKASGKIEKSRGWKQLFSNETEDKDEKEENTKLPVLEEGESAVADIKTKEGVTKPPKPYTEGQLINMMKTAGKGVEDTESQKILKETEGIGTEATRANIIETLKNQKYILIKKNNVEVTKKGEILCQAVDGNLLSKPDMTAEWEKYLKLIGKGTKKQSGFLKNIEKFIHLLIEKTPEHLATSNIDQIIEGVKEEEFISSCPVCGTGKFADKGKFYGCNNYSAGCKASLPKQFAGKNLSINMVKLLLEKGKTNKLKGFKKKDKSGTFDASLKVEIDTGNKQMKIGFDFEKRNRSRPNANVVH